MRIVFRRILKQYLLYLIKLYADMFLESQVDFNSREIKKILIYAYTGLGNFVLYTAALRSIRRLLPEAKITLLHGNDTGCCEMIFNENIFDDYIVVKRNASWWRKIAWLYRIRRRKYDLVVSEFHNNNLFVVLLTVLCGARFRLGHVSGGGWKNTWGFIYNMPVKMKDGQHERDRYLELIYALKGNKMNIDKKIALYLTREETMWAKMFLTKYKIFPHKHIIVSVHVGTSPAMRWKQWMPEKYRALCQKILKFPNTFVVLQGASSEREMLRKMFDLMGPNLILAAGETTVRHAAALIKMSNLLICNDSGLMHIAVAVDTPVVAIYGPTNPARTTPLGEKHTIIRKKFDCSPCFRLNGSKQVENCSYGYRCLNSISVNDVFEVVLEKLQKFQGKDRSKNESS